MTALNFPTTACSTCEVELTWESAIYVELTTVLTLFCPSCSVSVEISAKDMTPEMHESFYPILIEQYTAKRQGA